MEISSPEFENNGFIPEKFTCDGDNVNPVIVIRDIPKGAESLTVIVDDPDSEKGVWVHWILYDVPVVSRIEKNNTLGKQGTNDFGSSEYRGPCPQAGTHRYRFKVYALDTVLGLDIAATIQEVENAMLSHILDRDIMVGLYQSKMERESAGAVR